MNIDYDKIENDRARHVKLQNSDRYQNILCFLYSKGLIVLTKTPRIIRNRKISISDILWAGKYEPRILEVFPAAYIHFTSKFTDTKKIPKELKLIIYQIKNNEAKGNDYKGIEYRAMKRWCNVTLNDKRSMPVSSQKILRSFKFSKEVIDKLEKLAAISGETKTQIIESLVMSESL